MTQNQKSQPMISRLIPRRNDDQLGEKAMLCIVVGMAAVMFSRDYGVRP